MVFITLPEIARCGNPYSRLPGSLGPSPSYVSLLAPSPSDDAVPLRFPGRPPLLTRLSSLSIVYFLDAPVSQSYRCSARVLPWLCQLEKPFMTFQPRAP